MSEGDLRPVARKVDSIEGRVKRLDGAVGTVARGMPEEVFEPELEPDDEPEPPPLLLGLVLEDAGLEEVAVAVPFRRSAFR